MTPAFTTKKLTMMNKNYSGCALSACSSGKEMGLLLQPNEALLLTNADFVAIEDGCKLHVNMKGSTVDGVEVTDREGKKVWKGTLIELARALKMLELYRTVMRDAREEQDGLDVGISISSDLLSR